MAGVEEFTYIISLLADGTYIRKIQMYLLFPTD